MRQTFSYISDMPLVRKGPRLRNMSDLFCVVTSASLQICVSSFLHNEVRARKSGYQLKSVVHMFHMFGLTMRKCKLSDLEFGKCGKTV